MAIEYAIKIGLALNCTIAVQARFARKNYFYPDMPKDYQISQYDEPLCIDGWLDIVVADPDSGDQRPVRVEIERVHLEEDTGKSIARRLHRADPRRGLLARGLQPGRDPAGGDRDQAGGRHRGARARGGPDLRHGTAGPAARARRVRCADGRGFAALRREHVADPGGVARMGHPHRDQERELAALGGTRGPVGDPAAGRGAGRRRPGGAGDPALQRGDRDHLAGPEQGRGAGLPLLPRA